MKIARNITIVIHYILDQFIPPIIRDNKYFMSLLMRLSLGKSSSWLMNFKENLPRMSGADLEEYYRESASAHIERETDLNAKCVDRIKKSILGADVLDIACGRGYLAKELSPGHTVTGADFIIDPQMAADNPEITWNSENIEALTYSDDQFDTVICTHTLEHVVHVENALSELRRVAKQRLIIVLPKQRVYQYTFDLHVHFFQYIWQVEMLMLKDNENGSFTLELVGGDWFLIEDQ